MKKPNSPYIEWLKGLEFPELNLASSGMHSELTAGDLGVEARELALGGFAAFGNPDFKSVLSARYKVAEENIYLSTGATGCNFVIFATLFGAGDEILMETPVYDTIPAAAELAGCDVKYVPRRFENGYKIDPEELRKFFSDKTKALVITNLHNPSGMLLTNNEVKLLANICRERNVWLIIDEIYLEFYFDKSQGSAFHQGDNIIITSSLTKAYGVGGLRAGWAFAPAEVVHRAYDMYNFIGGANPYPGEYLAYRLLTNDEIVREIAEEPARLIRANLPLVEDFIERHTELEWVKPEWGISCFPRMESGTLVEKLHTILLNQYSTLIIPGKFFFAPRHFRLNFGIESEVLIKGLDNIDEALKRI